MAIEALYPSRLQSRRHNPLFRRERQARRFGAALVLSFCLLGFFTLRFGASEAAAEGAKVAKTEHILPTAALGPMLGTGQNLRKPVRIIPFYTLFTSRPENAWAR